MISFQYFYNTVSNATNGGNMEAQSKSMNEIQFRDIEIKSHSGWLGLFLHLIVVPVIGLLCFGLYALGGGGIALGGFLQLIIAVVIVKCGAVLRCTRVDTFSTIVAVGVVLYIANGCLAGGDRRFRVAIAI